MHFISTWNCIKAVNISQIERDSELIEMWCFDAEGVPERESPPETSVSSVEEIMKEKDIWRKGLGVFRRLGLDKTALAADDRCKLCLVHKTIQYD